MNFKLHKIITIPKAYIIYYYFQFYRLSFNKTISKELLNCKFKKVNHMFYMMHYLITLYIGGKY